MPGSFTAKIQELEEAKKACDRLESKIKDSDMLLKGFKDHKKGAILTISRYVGGLTEDECYTIKAEVKIETDEQFVAMEEMLNTKIAVLQKELGEIKSKYNIG